MEYAVLEKAYNTLTLERQKNVEQFVLFLVDQQAKENSLAAEVPKKNNFEVILDSFVGTTHVWDGIDPLVYQHKLRGEYRVD